MKLFLTLILLISIAFCFANAVQLKMHTQKQINYEKINKLGEQTCLLNGQRLSSYNGGYSLVSYNLNEPTENGFQQETFFETGYVDVDYENVQLFTNFEVNFDGQISQGSFWEFGGNKTEYYVSTISGELVCYVGPITVQLNGISNLEYLGDVNLGTIETEIYYAPTPANITIDTLLVNKADCSVTSYYSTNNGAIPGYSIENIFNYVENTVPSDFDLPSICFTNPTPANPTALAKKARKSAKLPSFIKRLSK